VGPKTPLKKLPSGVVQGGIRCGDPYFPSIFANLGDEQVLEFVLNKSGLMKGEHREFFSFFKERLPGVGSKPGSSGFRLFSHFHQFTAEPQRLPSIKNSLHM
jgi:hypothetical protein